MYEMINSILSDKKGALTFSCFGAWHLSYMAVFAAVMAIIIVSLRNKSKETKHRAADTAIGCAFALYIADLFLMPLAYGEIDIEKLPFHACTATCVMCFISRHNSFIGKFKGQLALLGFISNLVYVIYPAGLEWYQIHPLSYRVIQTLLFHGAMTAYGILSLLSDDIHPEWKKCYRELLTLIAMTAWALLGNTLYNGTVGEYSHSFNWFFVIQDPFYMLPKDIAPFVMPFVVISVFFAAELLLYAAYFAVKKLLRRQQDAR